MCFRDNTTSFPASASALLPRRQFRFSDAASSPGFFILCCSRLLSIALQDKQEGGTKGRGGEPKPWKSDERSYCSLVWHFCKASDRRKLERINERGLRTVFDNWKQPYEDLLRRAKLTTLTNKRLQDIATFTYKAKHKMLPPPVQELFTTGHTRYNLRNSDLFRTEHFNTKKYGKHSLCYYGPSLWSKLDRKLRASTSLGSFKNAIKKMDLEALMSDCSTCSLCNSYFYFCILFFLEGSPVLTVMPTYYLTLIYYCI